MLLEKAHLAHPLGRDSARGDIGHRSARKFQTRVSDVHFVCQDGDSHRFYFRHRLVDQRQQNIQVVDHQIVDYVHIEAARREDA